MANSAVITPVVLGFIIQIIKEYSTKKGENILEKSTDKTFEFLKKKLGNDEINKIRNLKDSEAKKHLGNLIRDKNLRKEVDAFYVLYKYLEKFSADSVFSRLMDFRSGEGLLLDKMYVELRIMGDREEQRDMKEFGYHTIDHYRTKGKISVKTDPNEIIDIEKGLICILGLPGAGKTTLCKYFSINMLRGKYKNHRFPVYIELRGIREECDPVTYAFNIRLKEQFTKEVIEEAIATIKHNSELFSPVYIFDGLDEVKIDRGFISESIRNLADSSLCIVTSRRSGFIYMHQNKTYEILSLEKEEKEKLVENYFRCINEEQRIDPFLRLLDKKEYNSISNNPMLLSILCALALDDKRVERLPSRKSELYGSIIVKMNEWNKHKGREELSQEQIKKLEDFALKLFYRNQQKILFEKGDINGEILDKATEIGLIYRWDEPRYSFLHLTLQEYLAACSLKRENWEKIVREKKDAVVWHEVIQLFASVLDKDKEYRKLETLLSIILESPDLLHLNCALAGHCLAEIDMDDAMESDRILEYLISEFEKGVCREVFPESFVHLAGKAVEPLTALLERTDSDDLRWRISEVLGKIKDPGTVDSLVNLLERTDNNYLKRRLSHALGEIRDPAAVNPLLNILERTDDADLRETILLALGKIKDPGAVNPLLNILERTDDADLRWRISEVLGKIKDPGAIEPLVHLLGRTDSDDLRWRISRALGEIKDPGAVEPLVHLLEETDDTDLRKAISTALGEIKDPGAVEPLVHLLEETDDKGLRKEISRALGKIGDPGAVKPLLHLLERTDDVDLKRRISEALGGIKDPSAVDPLIHLLERARYDDLMMSISKALAKIGDASVQPLLHLLERTDNSHLKKRISWALWEIKDPRALHHLISLLGRADDDLREAISWALVSLGDIAVEPLLHLLEETDDNDLKRRISLIFGEIKDPRALNHLISLLGRADDDLKIEISWTLGEIKDPRAVEPLVHLLEETDDNDLRKAISIALGKIKDPRAVEPLVHLLEETDDSDLRLRISEALGEIKDPGAVKPLVHLLEETDDSDLMMSISKALARIGDISVEPLIHLLGRTDSDDLRWRISRALGEIKNPRAIEPLIHLLERTDSDDLRWRISETLRNFNPIHLYPFMEKEKLLDTILSTLCCFSTEYNMRFFKDKIVLPEGEILPVRTERERRWAIKRVDKIIKKPL